MPGPVPSEVKRRRNKPVIDPTLVTPGAYSGESPALPSPELHHELTLKWYETMRTCEQAVTFTKTAWQALWDFSYVMDDFYNHPTTRKWNEIKPTLEQYLVFPASQRRAQFKVEPPKSAAVVSTSNVTNIADRRSRLIADAP